MKVEPIIRSKPKSQHKNLIFEPIQKEFFIKFYLNITKIPEIFKNNIRNKIHVMNLS